MWLDASKAQPYANSLKKIIDKGLLADEHILIFTGTKDCNQGQMAVHLTSHLVAAPQLSSRCMHNK